MKKLLLGAAVLLLMVSCSENGTTEKTKEDSERIADSIAQVEAAKVAAEQARQDSIRQDSIAKAKSAAQYDGLVDQYVSAVNTVEKAAKNGQWDKMQSLIDKAQRLRNKIDKIKNELTPEQSAKFKKAVSKWGRLCNGVIAG